MGTLEQAFTRERHTRRAGFLLLATLAALALLQPAPAAGATFESKDHNVELELDDINHEWRFLPKQATWAEYGIIAAAETRLEKYKNGEPAQGEGARLDLAVRDLAEGQTLEGLADNKDIRDFLLARFVSKGPLENQTLNMGPTETPVLGRVLRTKGRANNMASTESDCLGILVIAIVKKRVYLLRMYAWTTERDEEDLKGSIEYFENNSMSWMDLKAAAAAEADRPPPGEDGEEGEDETEEAGVEERLEFEEALLVMVKHPKLTVGEIDRDDRKGDMIAKFSDNNEHGAYDIFIWAYPKVSGVSAPAPRKMVGLDQYQRFLTSCPDGDIYTFKWPKKPTTPKAKTFLTVPELVEPARIIVFGGPRNKKRDPEASGGDIEKLKVLDSPKVKHVGSQVKASGNVWRSVMGGMTPRFGAEMDLKYGWETSSYVYVVYARFMRDAWPRWGEGVRSTLESIRMVKKKKWDKRWPD